MTGVARAVVAALSWCVLAGSSLPAQSARSLPDSEAFFRETRENLERAQRQYFAYAYKERVTELRTNPFGSRVGTGKTRAFAVTPAVDGSVVVRQLIEEDGQPVTDGKIERIETAPRRPRGGRRRRSRTEDAMAVLRFSLDRRERLDGRDHIVVRFEPEVDADAETREGNLAKRFRGEIWVDESAREIARVNATALDSISFGLGLLARLSKGSTATLERQRVDGDIWMPTRMQFTGEGRAFLFIRKLTVDHVIEWFDYARIPDAPVE